MSPLLMYGCDKAISRWVGERAGMADFGRSHDPSRPDFFRAIGVAAEGRVIAGVVFNNFRWPNMEVTFAADSPRWQSRRVIRAIFSYPFVQLGCFRLTAVTKATNQPCRAFLCRLGFREEGVMRRVFADGSEGILYGLLREECRWLAEESRIGKIQPLAATGT